MLLMSQSGGTNQGPRKGPSKLHNNISEQFSIRPMNMETSQSLGQSLDVSHS